MIWTSRGGGGAGGGNAVDGVAGLLFGYLAFGGYGLEGLLGEARHAFLVENYEGNRAAALDYVGLRGGKVHDGVGIVAVLTVQGVGNEVAPGAGVEAQA